MDGKLAQILGRGYAVTISPPMFSMYLGVAVKLTNTSESTIEAAAPSIPQLINMLHLLSTR